MAWIMIVTSLIFIWVSSLCKIFYASWSPLRNSFLNDGGSPPKKNVLLVIAHPDDESMFFTPTINYLTSRGHDVYILCLSTGNADGKGNIRKRELYQACAVLKIPFQNIKILDHPDLQDGFGQVWDHRLVANIIEKEIVRHGIDLIITFDNYGVSGHCNHRDVHHSVRGCDLSSLKHCVAVGESRLLGDTLQRKIKVWELVSTNLIRKYIGPVDIWLSILHAMQLNRGMMLCLLNENPKRSYLAMAQHMSQWVWFRKLFVTFSSYTYVNTLREVKYTD